MSKKTPVKPTPSSTVNHIKILISPYDASSGKETKATIKRAGEFFDRIAANLKDYFLNTHNQQVNKILVVDERMEHLLRNRFGNLTALGVKLVRTDDLITSVDPSLKGSFNQKLPVRHRADLFKQLAKSYGENGAINLVSDADVMIDHERMNVTKIAAQHKKSSFLTPLRVSPDVQQPLPFDSSEKINEFNKKKNPKFAADLKGSLSEATYGPNTAGLFIDISVQCESVLVSPQTRLAIRDSIVSSRDQFDQFPISSIATEAVAGMMQNPSVYNRLHSVFTEEEVRQIKPERHYPAAFSPKERKRFIQQTSLPASSFGIVGDCTRVIEGQNSMSAKSFCYGTEYVVMHGADSVPEGSKYLVYNNAKSAKAVLKDMLSKIPEAQLYRNTSDTTESATLDGIQAILSDKSTKSVAFGKIDGGYEMIVNSTKQPPQKFLIGNSANFATPEVPSIQASPQSEQKPHGPTAPKDLEVCDPTTDSRCAPVEEEQTTTQEIGQRISQGIQYSAALGLAQGVVSGAVSSLSKKFGYSESAAARHASVASSALSAASLAYGMTRDSSLASTILPAAVSNMAEPIARKMVGEKYAAPLAAVAATSVTCLLTGELFLPIAMAATSKVAFEAGKKVGSTVASLVAGQGPAEETKGGGKGKRGGRS